MGGNRRRSGIETGLKLASKVAECCSSPENGVNTICDVALCGQHQQMSALTLHKNTPPLP